MTHSHVLHALSGGEDFLSSSALGLLAHTEQTPILDDHLRPSWDPARDPAVAFLTDSAAPSAMPLAIPTSAAIDSPLASAHPPPPSQTPTTPPVKRARATAASSAIPAASQPQPSTSAIAKKPRSSTPTVAGGVQKPDISRLTKRAQRVIRTREAATRNRMEQRAKMARLTATNERLLQQSQELLSENRRLQTQVAHMHALRKDPALLRRVLAALSSNAASAAVKNEAQIHA